MKICLVTTFPPSRGGLSEYGLHIARELQQNSYLSVTILADQLAEPQAELEEFSVTRCWSFDDPGSAFRILAAIRKIKPDVVWFNLIFSTFGRRPLVAFGGLAIPLLTRLSGFHTHVTLHHLMDTMDLEDAGVRFPRLYRMAGAAATKLLLMANSVSVLMPGYRTILREKYRGQNVHLRPHGILSRRPEYPDFSRRGNPVHRILTFGKWGTYKRLEPMIEAFEMLARDFPEAKLVVGGGNHPHTPGYVESVAQRYANDARIEFRGYVADDDIPDLFQSASVAVMPYSSSAGSSGVAHLACAYGVPIICADIPDFRHMAEEEGLAMKFYQTGDTTDLANVMARFFRSAEQQQAMAEQNFTAALRMTMPKIIHQYLRHFDLRQRIKALRKVSRLRRLPKWLPSKSLLGRMVAGRALKSTYRSTFPSQDYSKQDYSKRPDAPGSPARPRLAPGEDHPA